MVSCLLATIALWSWPVVPRTGRRMRFSGTDRWGRWLVHLRWFARPAPGAPIPKGGLRGRSRDGILAAVLAGAGGVVLGPAVGVSAGLAFVTVAALIRAAGAASRKKHERAELLACVRTLARELRSGSAAMAAVRAAAKAHPGSGEAVMDALGAHINVDRPVGLGRSTGHPTAGSIVGSAASRDVLSRLFGGWVLSSRHGVPWAALIDALAGDLAEQDRAETARTAQVAGPRVSGYVLAAMPILGILLGFGMGADPLHVLFQTSAGGIMLLVGTGLTCAGLQWTSKIVGG